jgi:hypothetical protein
VSGEVTELVKEADLRGRGGAGFPRGGKWSFVLTGDDALRPKYLIANADEMEPGTFKNRLPLEGDPHQLLEGMIVSAHAIQADIAYLFSRAEYTRAATLLTKAIAEAYDAGYLGRNILGSGYKLRAPAAHQCRSIHVRRRDGPAACAGRQAGYPIPRSAACGANPPSSGTSRRCATCRTSWRTRGRLVQGPEPQR